MKNNLFNNNLSDSDNELIVRFATGDRDAFDKLLQKHQKMVINVAYRFLGTDRDDAEDIAQEVFIKVHKSANKYKPTAKFSTWLYRITVNTCLNELRRRKIKKLFYFQNLIDKDKSTIRDKGSENETELIEKVKVALDSLPTKQKMALILRRYDGLSHEEIGKILNLSVPATKSLIFRGMDNLKKKLAPISEKELSKD